MSIRNIEALVAHLESLPSPISCKIVAVDGCGGAGKSTYADALCTAWPGSTVIHTDDFASWDCPLDWWPRLVSEVLVPLSRGNSARFQKFDWVARQLSEWQTVATSRLILEGVSSSRREFRPFLAYSIWIDTPRELRLRRGLDRDGEAMLLQWEEWMAAEDGYMADHQPLQNANLILSGAGDFVPLDEPR